MKIHIKALNEHLEYELTALSILYQDGLISYEVLHEGIQAITTLKTINNRFSTVGKRSDNVEIVDRYDF